MHASGAFLSRDGRRSGEARRARGVLAERGHRHENSSGAPGGTILSPEVVDGLRDGVEEPLGSGLSTYTYSSLDMIRTNVEADTERG